MIWTMLHWASVILMWGVIIHGIWDARRAAALRRAEDMTRVELAAYTGLTPLQIQVAMDDATAAFHQRLFELQQGRVDG